MKARLIDLSGKFGTFENRKKHTSTFNDTMLPLFGLKSILGRSIVIHKKEKNLRSLYFLIYITSYILLIVISVFNNNRSSIFNTYFVFIIHCSINMINRMYH